jgi:hypothetical protein
MLTYAVRGWGLFSDLCLLFTALVAYLPGEGGGGGGEGGSEGGESGGRKGGGQERHGMQSSSGGGAGARTGGGGSRSGGRGASWGQSQEHLEEERLKLMRAEGAGVQGQVY